MLSPRSGLWTILVWFFFTLYCTIALFFNIQDPLIAIHTPGRYTEEEDFTALEFFLQILNTKYLKIEIEM